MPDKPNPDRPLTDDLPTDGPLADGERHLDPDDWHAFRALAHRMVDDTLDFLSKVETEPVWHPMPDAAKETVRGPLPRAGRGESETYKAFAESIQPFTNGNRHPRFFGWVQSCGTPLGMMADMLAAAMNPHCAGFEQASTYVEEQVIEWLRQLMGFPKGSSGILLGGGTMANFVALAAARDDRAGFDVFTEGLQSEHPPLVFYGSSELHGWAPKTANLLGIGTDSFRVVGVDQRYRLRLDELRAAIARDRASGRRPFCVAASAGTVTTGAVDDLDAIADLCRDEDLWFHVDGAFGAWARVSSTHGDAVRGMERADSLAFDLHKWGYLPFEIACVLVRDAAAHRRPFAISGSYIVPTERGTLSAGLPYADLGLELTRGFKALKAWMLLNAYGVDRIATILDQNLAQAGRLIELVEAAPDLELLAPTDLNVVCFRVQREGYDEGQLDGLNREVLMRVQESGVAVPSSASPGGRFGLRACFVNHRTRASDVDRLVRVVREVSTQVRAD